MLLDDGKNLGGTIKMKYKVGFVGCGRIAGLKDKPSKDDYIVTHAQAFCRHPLFELSAVTCPNNYKKFQEIWNLPNSYATLDEMLKYEKLDVISVCSPNTYHFPQIVKILKSQNCPKIIFAEKPICLNSSELEKLKSLSNKSNCKILVNHTRRYDPGHIRVRKYIDKGELGNLVCGRCDYYGGWLHNGCHLVDTLRMLFDDDLKVEEVNAGPPGRDNDPCYNVKLSIRNAPVDLIGFDKDYYQIYDSEFRFENGRIRIQDFGKQISIEKALVNKNNDRVLLPLSDSPWKGLDSPIYHAVDLIGNYLEKDEPLSGHGVLIDEVSNTMLFLWKTKEMYEKKK